MSKRKAQEAALKKSGWWVNPIAKGYEHSDFMDEFVQLEGKRLQEYADYWRKLYEKERERREEALVAIMKLLGIREQFPYKERTSKGLDGEYVSKHGWQVFEEDLLLAAKDFDAEKALKRIRKAVRERLGSED